MQSERVILAAFSTNAVRDLPVGRTRVATLHLQRAGTAPIEFRVELRVAAGPDGGAIKASASAEERKPK
jgi:hypothetical protein